MSNNMVTIPCVPPVLVGDEEVVEDGVAFIELGSTLKVPNLSCSAAVLRVDITSFPVTF